MRIKSISGVVCYVTDMAKTIKFYEALGFRLGKRDGDVVTAYVNWFWVQFRLASGTDAKKPGDGMYMYINVEDLDELCKSIVRKKIKPVSNPADTPSGRRECMFIDPDGYRLVFFQDN